MSEFDIVLDLISKIKKELENMKATEKISDYLLEEVFFQREQHSTVFKLHLDFYINVKRDVKGDEG